MHHLIAVTARPVAHTPGGYREAPQQVELSEAEHLPHLAARLGTTVYELRGRFAGGSPWLLGRLPDAGEADALCQWLRRNGFGAVTLDVREIGAAVAAARGPVVMEPDALVLGAERVAYDEITSVIDALLLVEHSKDKVEQRTAVSLNPRNRHVYEVTSVAYAKDRQRALFVFDRRGAARRVDQHLPRASEFGGLTALARFEAMREALRARCPSALFDERLVTAPRKRTSFSFNLTDGDPTSSRNDNAQEATLAAVVLHRAAQERQRC